MVIDLPLPAGRFLPAVEKTALDLGYMGSGTSGAKRPMFRSPQLDYHLVFSMERSD